VVFEGIGRVASTGGDSYGVALESAVDRLRIVSFSAVGLALAIWAYPAFARGDDRSRKAPARLAFEELAVPAGVSFRFDTGSRGKHDLPEIMGGGVALFDADGDGRLDIYLCNGGPIEPAPGRRDPPCRLYRNLGGWRFEDITDSAAAPGPSYAMGAAVGDYDGDGRLDLLVTGWRDQRLYHNTGKGRFEDVTGRAGLLSTLWSTSAAFADLDGDGDLDLYVANYLEFDAKSAPYCAAPDGRRDYCGPEDFPAQPDRLYRNNGDGTFTDVARSAGIDRPEGRGLGVVIAELTGDNRPDIYVANDGTACWLFANRGSLQFEEVGEIAGVARDGQGQVLAGMGVAVGDMNADGLLDLVATNFLGRSTIGYLAAPSGQHGYADATSRLGLSNLTRGVLGFGVALVDFDADGYPDLIETNGHVLDRARLGTPLAMRQTILRGTGNGFHDAASGAGPWFNQPILGRGLATGDLDGDGRPDAVAGSLDSPAAILRNVSSGGEPLCVQVVDRHGHPAVGAKVVVTGTGGRRQTVTVAGGGSYLAASEPRAWIGSVGAGAILRVEIDWPWGEKEAWTRPVIAGNHLLRLTQGTGTTERTGDRSRHPRAKGQ
jgi:enediyne biosynthesis protein E4